MIKARLQHSFNRWLDCAYAEPGGRWHRRLCRWYGVKRQTPIRRFIQRRIKRAMLHHAHLPIRDLGWQPLGIDDILIRADSGNLLTAPLYLRAPAPRLFDIYREFARPGTVAIDVGTNNGAHALVMAAAVGATGKVLGFEPTSRMHAAALANCHRNGAHQVTVANVAVADREGEARFDDTSDQPNPGISRIAAEGGRTVRLVTLDQQVAPDHEVTLLKVDVEGHELAVLRGARALLQRWRPAVVVEFNLHTYRWEELLAAFPYPVAVHHIPNRPHLPTRRLADATAAGRINARHIDVLVLPASGSAQ